MVISVASQKGGCGKTTTAYSLGDGFARFKGKKVLLIDLDHQANMSFWTDLDAPFTIYHLMKNRKLDKNAIVNKNKNLDIILSDENLAGADMEFMDNNREFILSDILKPVINDYDYIIIDLSPSLSILTVNALAISDSVIIPVCAEIFSIQGLYYLYNSILSVKSNLNSKLKIVKVLITRFKKRTKLNQNLIFSIEEMVKKMNEETSLEIDIFNSKIRESTIIGDAQARNKSIFEYSSKSYVAQDYISFIDEFYKIINDI